MNRGSTDSPLLIVYVFDDFLDAHLKRGLYILKFLTWMKNTVSRVFLIITREYIHL